MKLIHYVKSFNVRRFFTIFLITAPVSFLTFLTVQYFQGNIESLVRIAGKAAVVAVGLAIMFSLPERQKRYPWM